MMSMKRKVAMALTLGLVVGFAGLVAAGPFEDGWNAYDRGDYAAAIRLWRSLADQNYAKAQYNLGFMYDKGQGIQQDYASAMSWYRKASNQGYAPAQYSLGLMYANGQGGRPDYTAAVSWYRKAANQGYAAAQYSLGFMYDKGQGVPQDYASAVSWYRKAADQGDGNAQLNLGFLYTTGQGVPQDYASAVSWYRKAADQGDASAQYNLGLMYANGQGAPQDDVSAHMWFNLLAARGSKDATKNRDVLAARMHPAQIAEAQKRAHEWRPKMASAAPTQASQRGVPLKMDGGIFVVPVQINGTMTLDFVIDSGAADVSVPADVVSTLMRAGTIKETDFIGQQTYVLGDGSKSKSVTFTIRSLRLGDMVLENVRGSVASSQGSLLLGQSFLERFNSWSIDNTRHELLLEPR
jgi:clan AA aspartic protease (TIGR02281 family)